jgi:hypothetical protein
MHLAASSSENAVIGCSSRLPSLILSGFVGVEPAVFASFPNVPTLSTEQVDLPHPAEERPNPDNMGDCDSMRCVPTITLHST